MDIFVGCPHICPCTFTQVAMQSTLSTSDITEERSIQAADYFPLFLLQGHYRKQSLCMQGYAVLKTQFLCLVRA